MSLSGKPWQKLQNWAHKVKNEERKTRRKKRNCKAYLTLSCPTFFLKKPHFLPFKRFLSAVFPNATKLCYKSVFFSYILARFWTSFCCKLYNISLSCMRISQNLVLFFCPNLVFVFLRTHFQFFSRFFCFPFSLPFFSLYLLPFIPFLSTGKVWASAPQKT